MQHSLRHRFQGALLGAVLGEALGLNCQERAGAKSFASAPAWIRVQHWGFSAPAASALVWSHLAAQQSNRLMQGKCHASQSHAPQNPQQQKTCASVLPPSLSPQTPLAGLSITTLPIALFYHEDWYRLRDLLEQIALTWHSSPPLASIWTVAYTISLSLRERLHLDTLIPRLITDLELYDRDPQLMQQLNQMQTWIQQGVEVAMVKALIQSARFDPDDPTDPTPVTVALYGFLSTPTDFRLSLLRTAQILHQPQLSCAIVGALSGAYNSVAGIPLQWRQSFNVSFNLKAVQPPQPETQTAIQAKLLPAEAELRQQADLLWATWSGADHPTEWLQRPLHPTIASPHLIRPCYR
jgi:hypothetical protein